MIYNTTMIIFPLILQTIVIAQIVSTGGRAQGAYPEIWIREA